VMAHLRLPIPQYARQDQLLVSHELGVSLPRTAHCSPRRAVHLRLSSPHGESCPLPWLEACRIRFTHCPSEPLVLLSAPTWCADVPIGNKGSPEPAQLTAELQLEFARGTSTSPVTLLYHITAANRPRRGERTVYDIVTSQQSYPDIPWNSVLHIPMQFLADIDTKPTKRPRLADSELQHPGAS
jgi:hypothetical protein